MSHAVATLPPEARSVGQVRRLARESIAGWGIEELEWTLSQLVTELATNAVIHAGTAFEVRLSFTQDRLRCEVTDSSPRIPRPRRYSLEATTGRGLRLLEQLSAAWGVTTHAGGKTIWFELVPGDDDRGHDPDLDMFGDLAGDLAAPPQPDGRAAQAARADSSPSPRSRARSAA